jgi:hypothetical protein
MNRQEASKLSKLRPSDTALTNPTPSLSDSKLESLKTSQQSRNKRRHRHTLLTSDSSPSKSRGGNTKTRTLSPQKVFPASQEVMLEPATPDDHPMAEESKEDASAFTATQPIPLTPPGSTQPNSEVQLSPGGSPGSLSANPGSLSTFSLPAKAPETGGKAIPQERSLEIRSGAVVSDDASARLNGNVSVTAQPSTTASNSASSTSTTQLSAAAPSKDVPKSYVQATAPSPTQAQGQLIAQPEAKRPGGGAEDMVDEEAHEEAHEEAREGADGEQDDSRYRKLKRRIYPNALVFDFAELKLSASLMAPKQKQLSLAKQQDVVYQAIRVAVGDEALDKYEIFSGGMLPVIRRIRGAPQALIKCRSAQAFEALGRKLQFLQIKYQSYIPKMVDVESHPWPDRLSEKKIQEIIQKANIPLFAVNRRSGSKMVPSGTVQFVIPQEHLLEVVKVRQEDLKWCSLIRTTVCCSNCWSQGHAKRECPRIGKPRCYKCLGEGCPYDCPSTTVRCGICGGQHISPHCRTYMSQRMPIVPSLSKGVMNVAQARSSVAPAPVPVQIQVRSSAPVAGSAAPVGEVSGKARKGVEQQKASQVSDELSTVLKCMTEQLSAMMNQLCVLAGVIGRNVSMSQSDHDELGRLQRSSASVAELKPKGGSRVSVPETQSVTLSSHRKG